MTEPLNATFFALQKGEPGGVLLGAFVCYLVISVILLTAFVAPTLLAFGFDFRTLAMAPTPPNPMAALWLLPLGLFVVFFYCVATASFEAACLRWMIRGERPGLFGMTLDNDTWRIYGIYWIWLLCYGVAWIGFFILNGLLSYLAADNQVLRWIVLGIYWLLILIAAAALGPASAVTVAVRRMAFGDATEATEAHFVSLLGTYVALFGGQWLVNWAAITAWMAWKLQDDLLPYFEHASDPASAYASYNAATSAAVLMPGALPEYWAISAATFVVSLALMVLIYGANARVALLALQEGRISATASP